MIDAKIVIDAFNASNTFLDVFRWLKPDVD